MASGVYFLAPVHPRRGGWKMSTVQYLLPRSLPGASISVPLLGTAQQTSSVQVVYECESAMVSGLWRPLKGYLLEAKHNEYLRSGGLPRGAVGRPPADGGKIQGATPCQKTLSSIRQNGLRSKFSGSRTSPPSPVGEAGKCRQYKTVCCRSFLGASIPQTVVNFCFPML